MNFHWISDQSKLNNFYIHWDHGKDNKADYHTKHHPPNHHRMMRDKYILKGYNMTTKNVQHLTARVCCSPDTITEQYYQQTKVGTIPNNRWHSRLVNDNGQFSLV